MRLNRLNVFRPSGALHQRKAEAIQYSFFDDFARDDGAIGNGWHAGLTWAISSGKVLNSPIPGSNIFPNGVGGFEGTYAGGKAPGWNTVGGTSQSEETIIVHEGVSAQKITVASNSTALQKIFSNLFTIGDWYSFRAWAYPDVNVNVEHFINDTTATHGDGLVLNFANTWNEHSVIFKPRGKGWFEKSTVGGAATVIFDDFSINKFTFTDLIATRETSISDVDISIDATRGSLLMSNVGIIANLDSNTNPLNYLMAFVRYHNNYNNNLCSVIVDKCVNGVTTNLINVGNLSYGAGRTLRLVKDGTSVGVFYNGTQVGDTITVSNLSVLNNKIHGMFSVHGSDTIDNVVITNTEDGGGLKTPVVGTNNIFGIGDSIMACGGSTDSLVYHTAATVQERTQNAWFQLPTQYAVGSLTTAGAATNIDGQLAGKNETPTYVLILLGANDLSVTEADWKTNYRYILDAVHAKWPSTAIHCGKSFRQSGALPANQWIPDMIAEHPDYLFGGFDLADVLDGKTDIYTSDGLHPNHDGCVAIGEQWATVLGYPAA